MITVLLKLNMLQSKRSFLSKLLETESETAYDHNSYMETKLNVSVSLKTNCKHKSKKSEKILSPIQIASDINHLLLLAWK